MRVVDSKNPELDSVTTIHYNNLRKGPTNHNSRRLFGRSHVQSGLKTHFVSSYQVPIALGGRRVESPVLTFIDLDGLVVTQSDLLVQVVAVSTGSYMTAWLLQTQTGRTGLDTEKERERDVTYT
jgi:hypothetical protein